MNRNVRESLVGGRNIPAVSQHRRGRSLNGVIRDTTDENLDLFSRNRRSLSVTSSDESSDGTGLLSRAPLLISLAWFYAEDKWSLEMTAAIVLHFFCLIEYLL